MQGLTGHGTFVPPPAGGKAERDSAGKAVQPEAGPGVNRAIRCSVLDIDKHGVNRCASEACDPDDSVLMCVGHRIKVLGDLASLPGLTISIEAQPAHRKDTP